MRGAVARRTLIAPSPATRAPHVDCPCRSAPGLHGGRRRRAARLLPRPLRRERRAAGKDDGRVPARPCVLATELPSRGSTRDSHAGRTTTGLPGVRSAHAPGVARIVGGAEEIGAVP